MTDMLVPHQLIHASLDETLAGELAVLREQGLARTTRVVARRQGALVETDTGVVVDFASNDYLGLATDPRLATAAARALREYGVGAAASRLITGNNAEHDALERELASFFDVERALAFSSGYAANVGIIPALVGRGDAIFADALNHASLIDGARASRATIHVYAHADTAALETLLALHRGAARRALLLTDGMFSMDGDRAPLAGLADLARRYDAWTYVDDAHALGASGPGGRGTAAAQQADVDVLVGTLGKAFGAAGAFVLGSATLCEYLLNRARSFVFSTAPLPAQAAAAREGVHVVRGEPERREQLAANTRALRGAFASRGIRCLGESGAHVIPIVVGDAARAVTIGATLVGRGFLVGAVRPPTVAPGTSRLRVTASAAHTGEQIAAIADALAAELR